MQWGDTLVAQRRIRRQSVYGQPLVILHTRFSADVAREYRLLPRLVAAVSLAALLDLLLLQFLVFVLGWTSVGAQLAGNLLTSALAAFVTYALLEWLLLRQSDSGAVSNRRVYVATVAAGIALSLAIYIYANFFLFSKILPMGLSIQLAKTLAVGVLMLWNFASSHYWLAK